MKHPVLHYNIVFVGQTLVQGFFSAFLLFKFQINMVYALGKFGHGGTLNVIGKRQVSDLSTMGTSAHLHTYIGCYFGKIFSVYHITILGVGSQIEG
jgi:hypothetical protein